MTTIPEVPEGHVHRSVLIEGAWTAGMVDQHLSAFALIVPVEQAGLSNKAYPLVEVERIQREVPEVARAVAAAASVLPRTGPYDGHNTVSRGYLLARGWTGTHIRRLLGDPDWTSSSALYGESHHFGRDRVEVAEATDAKLMKRLATVRDRQAAQKSQRIEEALAGGRAVWRQHAGEWVAQGQGLTVGGVIDVAKRDGTCQPREVLAIIATDPDGVSLARVGPVRPQAPAPSQPLPQHPAPRPQEPVARRAPHLVSLDPLTPGTVLEHEGEWVLITSARPLRVEEDTPSVWGSHLLGHEGATATIAGYRPATAQEAAPHAATARRQQDHVRAQGGRAAAVRAVIDYVREHAVTEQGPPGAGAESLWSSRNIHGSGEELRVGDGRLILIEWRGMDGDDWSANTVPGGIWSQTPLTDGAAALVEALRTASTRLDELGGFDV